MVCPLPGHSAGPASNTRIVADEARESPQRVPQKISKVSLKHRSSLKTNGVLADVSALI
jgi:hypothetical protein